MMPVTTPGTHEKFFSCRHKKQDTTTTTTSLMEEIAQQVAWFLVQSHQHRELKSLCLGS